MPPLFDGSSSSFQSRSGLNRCAAACDWYNASAYQTKLLFLATNVCWVIHCKTSVLRGAGGVVASTFETGERQTRRTFVSHLTTSRTSQHRAYPEWFYPLVQDKPFLTFGMPRDVFISMAGAAEFTLGFGLRCSSGHLSFLALTTLGPALKLQEAEIRCLAILARIRQARGPSGQFDLGRDCPVS